MKIKKAGVVSVFNKPYEVWTRRKTTKEEANSLMRNGAFVIDAMEVNDKCIKTVSNHIEAATHILLVQNDNALVNHIEKALATSAEYTDLLNLMPPTPPKALISFQSTSSKNGLALADDAIKANGVEIAENQFLFHGGHWPSDSLNFKTSRPFSTSFCPQIALNNAMWKGKAYDAGQVNLIVVRVTQSKTKAFAYSSKGSHGNEKEIVFASGAKLTYGHKTLIADITVHKMDTNTRMLEKVVPAYLIEAEIS